MVSQQEVAADLGGLKWPYEVDCGRYCCSPYIGVSWVGEFPLHPSKMSSRFTLHGNPLKTKSYDSDVHLGAPQAKWSHCNGTSSSLGYMDLYNICRSLLGGINFPFLYIKKYGENLTLSLLFTLRL